jgi:D-lactate dehydrogenase
MTEFKPCPRNALKIAVFSAQNYVRDQMGPLVDAFPGSFFIEAVCSPSTAVLCKGADAVCLFVNDEANKEVIDTFQKEGIKLILMRCAGYDRVDVDATEAAGIPMVRVPAYSPYAVAEHALALALTLNRKVHRAVNRVREGNFSLSGLVGFDMHGKTIGIVGTGNIGQKAASIFNGLGMELLAQDVYPNDVITQLGGKYVDLDELLAKSDVISLHVPLLPSTKHLINADSIAIMKKGVVLINVSRGGLVDTGALIAGLKSGQIGACGMDVYEKEADLFFKDHSQLDDAARMNMFDMEFAMLRNFPNVIITPHSAFLTKEALENICSTTMSNATEFAEGKDLTNRVKKQYK